MKCQFRAALIRSIRGYQMLQRTGCVDASARQPHDIGAASSANPYLTFEVLTSEVMHRYLLMTSSYERAA
jgi:hypothetical protein